VLAATRALDPAVTEVEKQLKETYGVRDTVETRRPMDVQSSSMKNQTILIYECSGISITCAVSWRAGEGRRLAPRCGVEVARESEGQDNGAEYFSRHDLCAPFWETEHRFADLLRYKGCALL
jgi:hypothetical protein